MNRVYAVVDWNNYQKCYFFSKTKYSRYDTASDRADKGYPKPIAGNWPGLFESAIDAAVNWGNGKAYFFKGSEYIRFDIATDQVDAGYPQPISAHWPGLFENNIDAAVNWGDGKVYFFKGSKYIRYDIATDRADDGYPKLIPSNWPGLWVGLDAAINWGNGKAYFFRGSEYMRYDMATDQVDTGYPKPFNANYWPGLAPKVDSSGRRFHSGGIWSQGTTLAVSAGQSVNFIINTQLIHGTMLTITETGGQKKEAHILPGVTTEILFTSFGNEPMGWQFNISTQSSAFQVSWELYSTWVPGDLFT